MHSFPQIRFQFVFTNPFTIRSLLRETPTLPADLNSCVVYLFTCSQCGLRYVGSSSRWLRHRILEHRGLSVRTSFPLSKPPFSAIREHSLALDHPFTNLDFRELSSCPNRLDLLISESLFIKRMKPELNNNSSGIQLAIVWLLSRYANRSLAFLFLVSGSLFTFYLIFMFAFYVSMFFIFVFKRFIFSLYLQKFLFLCYF